MDQFMDMSLREVSLSLNAISVRKHNTFVAQASLHGIKMKPIQHKEENPLASEKLKDSADLAMKKAIERRKK